MKLIIKEYKKEQYFVIMNKDKLIESNWNFLLYLSNFIK